MVYDVAIIGAGPAGGSAALHAARNGLKAVVLEEHPSIGEPVHCGECLSELAIQKMKLQLPPEVISLDVKGVRIIFPDHSDKLVSEPGYVLEKHKFEQWLCGEAQKLGAEIKLGHKVTDVKMENNAWKINCANGQTIEAKIIIDGSGVSSIISAKLNLNKRFESVIGIQYEMGDVKNDGYMDFYLWPKYAPNGYLWMIPKCNGRANVGLVTDQNTKAKVYLDEFCKVENFEGKKIAKTFGGLIPSSGPLGKTVDDGLILIGDAAWFTSPLYEGGSHLGLMSGKYAADVAKEAIGKNDFSKEFLGKYEKLWKSDFPDYGKILKGRDTLYNFTDEELNEMSAVMPKELYGMSLLQKIGVGLKILLNHRHLLKKGVIRAFKAFEYSLARHYGW